ncbi:hypothetical protein PYW08_010067 [Mythimna loreyi]|uniref:Uncharacterized protein n=1 Tax=Mythimna loreyi TaxID=667449 RepID=A0ACC2Q5U5_9NEOP|nr:hypothetical protein PYW08_010067 [Mythimna loreyi]
MGALYYEPEIKDGRSSTPRGACHLPGAKKSDNAVDMDLVEKEAVTERPVNLGKSREILSDNMDKDHAADLAVWTQYGPSYRPPIPDYPLGPEGFVFPQNELPAKTAQGYPGGTGRPQAHAYPGGGGGPRPPPPPPPPAPATGGGGPRGRARGRNQANQESSDSSSSSSSEATWEYTPETKNRWLRKVFGLATGAYLIVTIAVLVMDEVLGPQFEAKTNVKSAIVAAVCLLLLVIIHFAQSACHMAILPPPAFFILIIGMACLSVFFTFMTVFLETYVIILASMAMTLTCALLMALTFTKFDFNSWSMYALVPVISLGVFAALLGMVSKLLLVQYGKIELGLIFIIMLFNCGFFVYLLQNVLSGNFEEYEDEIYVYTAIMLITTFVVLFIIYVQLTGRSRRRRRRTIVF